MQLQRIERKWDSKIDRQKVFLVQIIIVSSFVLEFWGTHIHIKCMEWELNFFIVAKLLEVRKNLFVAPGKTEIFVKKQQNTNASNTTT